MTTPTPSDAAMAAATEIANGFLCYHTESKFTVIPSEIQPIIDRHFAPLREELARNQADWQKVVKEVLACDPIPACRRADDQLEPPWEVIARIRASNDKLRAALEYIDRQVCEVWKPVDGDTYQATHRLWCIDQARAALAPERKETT